MANESDPTMGYLGRPAAPDLQPWVTNVWYYGGPRPRRLEKILPMPIVHLIVNLSEPYSLVARGGEPVNLPFASGFLSGLLTRYLVIENPDEIRNMGAEFAPFGIAAFTSTPPLELTDVVQDAAAVLAGGGELRERGIATRSAEEALDALEDSLRAMLRPDFEADQVALAACRLIQEQPGLPIADVAERCGVSHKTLIATFRRHVGLTPKAFANLCRFHRFISDLPMAGEMPRWSELVSATDYYDQAHFVRAFREFTGFTPSEYLDAMRRFGPEYPSFVPMEAPGLPEGHFLQATGARGE
ncbi:MAG: AraC family transcriptional regulator [Pseudolysinimonas sp.]